MVSRNLCSKTWTHADSSPNCEEVILSFYTFMSYPLYNDYTTFILLSFQFKCDAEK